MTIATIEIQAPWENFVAPMMIATTAVVVAPKPLTIMLRRQPGSRSRSQCLTMPPCDRVNETNTPKAYSGISLVTLAS